MIRMDRILVIGSPGSGKTTFSLQLAAKTRLPLTHLDQLYWNDNWVSVPSDIFDAKLLSELQKTHWIIDGNYGRTLPLRLKYCDTVLYLDYPRLLCLWGAFLRIIKNYGKSRPDMGGNCPERFDWDFIHSIWHFPKLHRKKYQAMLRDAPGITVHIFHSRREAAHWLSSL